MAAYLPSDGATCAGHLRRVIGARVALADVKPQQRPVVAVIDAQLTRDRLNLCQ